MFQCVKSSTYYFRMKTKILADFRICISVPLNFWKCLTFSFKLTVFLSRIFLSILKSHNVFFRECAKILLSWKFLKIPKEMSLAEFFSSNSSCPTYQLYLYWKLTPPEIFPVSAPRIFKIAVEAATWGVL